MDDDETGSLRWRWLKYCILCLSDDHDVGDDALGWDVKEKDLQEEETFLMTCAEVLNTCRSGWMDGCSPLIDVIVAVSSAAVVQVKTECEVNCC